MKDVLFFLVEADGRVRQIVNGVVTSIGTRKSLPQAPIGSQEISLGWQRSDEYYGNIRAFSLPLGFVMDGAKILRNDAYKFNVDRELYLLILKYVSEIDTINYKNYYKFLYKGQIDFSTFKDKQGDRIVEVQIMEGGLNKLLKSQANTKYSIPFDDDAINVLMDGIDLFEKHNFVTINEGTVFEGPGLMGIAFVSKEGQSSGVATFTVYPGALPGSLSTSSEYFLITTDAITDMRIKGRFDFTFTNPPATPSFEVVLITPAGRTISLGTGNTSISTFDFDETFSTSAGEKFFLVLSELANLFAGSGVEFSETNIELTYFNRAASSVVKAFRPYDLYKKICIKMGIDEQYAISTKLQSCSFCITCGDGIRGLDNSAIKTTLNEFFKAFNVYLMAGLSVENNTLRFEGREHFFVPDSVTPATELGDAKDMEITMATDLMFSSIKIGHADQVVDDVNGKYDFNGSHVYSSPVKSVNKQLDLQSPWKAGPYEIEITRLNLEGKTTTDNSNDNDVFVIDVDCVNIATSAPILLSFIASGNYIVFQSTTKVVAGQRFQIIGSASNDRIYTVTEVEDLGATQTVHTDATITVTEAAVNVTIAWLTGQIFELDRSINVTAGVPSPETIFNVRLSPDRLLVTHYPWIRSFLYGYDSEEVKFESTNRNSDLVAGGLIQKRNHPIDEMGTPIALPFYLEHGTRVPTDLVEVLETNINKCFATDWENTRYTGFLLKAGIAPVNAGEQTYKHLLTYENDPETLIL